MRKLTLVLTSLALLAACGGGDDDALGFREVSPGPGDRAVTPSDPLEIPPTLDLPQPTPGGVNRADPG